MYRHSKQVITAGTPAEQAKKAIVMLHGRGASASGIVSLKDHLELDDYAIFAPQAAEHSWYPYSFMAPVENNQPALDSALEVIGELVDDIKQKGIAQENIYFLGFSQGACLTLEYTGRNAGQYGGIIAFTGGLIGQELIKENYKGDFNNTPVLITTGDPDPHVPVSRVNESVEVLKELNAKVTLKIYKGRQHTISGEELVLANAILKN
jgi:phospholipase/carboxylesterase